MNKFLKYGVLLILLAINFGSKAEAKEVTIKGFDASLLNKELEQELQALRRAEKLKVLTTNSSLNAIALKWQSLLEFRSFVKREKIESKINRKLKQDVKSVSYEGTLCKSIALQVNGLKYDRKREFVYDKTSSDDEFGLYYGSKKELKKSVTERTAIDNFTYRELAKEILSQLNKKQRKAMLSKVYQDVGIQVQWNYKTLNKRKIPQMKAIIILGGMQTIGIR